MADVANDRQHTGLELPIVDLPSPPEPGAVTPPPTLADLVRQSDLGPVELLTGEVGMDRPVHRVTLLTDAAMPERDLADAVLTGDVLAVQHHLPAALAIGHSSGRDLVAGLLGAVQTLTVRLPYPEVSLG